MKKIIIICVFIVVIILLAWAGVFYFKNLRGAVPLIKRPSVDLLTIMNKANPNISVDPLNSILKLPAGFSISVFAKDLPGARVMVFDQSGNLWLSQTSEGKISELIIKNNQLQSQKIVFSGLKNPHGLVFDPVDPNILYIAEETKISKVIVNTNQPETLQKIIDLPIGGRHFTRTLGFGPDGRLYVSIGSTCNVCNESDSKYASIYSLNKDGTDWKQVAKGLRNSVFFVWNNNDEKIWATDNGRDLLGDNIPPDELNVIDTKSISVSNYGWPICYGKNIHDTDFDKNTYVQNPCQAPFALPSYFDFQAHSANLGLAFVPDNSSWPKEYLHNLIVAFHGSWNRTVPTGYKIVRLSLDNKEQVTNEQDFVTGWLTPNDSVLGRPVDVIFDKEGNLYISDDRIGAIYRVIYSAQ